jgi:hypothetical protein
VRAEAVGEGVEEDGQGFGQLRRRGAEHAEDIGQGAERGDAGGLGAIAGGDAPQLARDAVRSGGWGDGR